MRRSPLRAAVVASSGIVVLVSCLSACAGGVRTEAAAHSASPVAASASASATSSPTPIAPASPSATVPSPTPSRPSSPAASRGVSGGTPAPVAHTTAASASTGTAQATFTYGQISSVSLISDTLCFSVPTTVTNTGSGPVYAVQAYVSVEAWRASAAKVALAVPARSSRQTTFSFCISGFTQPGGVCYVAFLDGRYWGAPSPALIDLGGDSTRNFCAPGGPSPP